MSVRTAGKLSPVILAAVLLFGAWVGVNVFRVFDAMGAIWAEGGDLLGTAVGQATISGIMGVLVMLAVLGLLVALYGALSETDPVPDRFPPERGENV
jgi:hypothetical protein